MMLKVTFYLLGLTKCRIICRKKMFPFPTMLLLYLFFGLQELIKVIRFNYVITFSFFYENAQNLGRSEDGKKKKKGDGLMD